MYWFTRGATHAADRRGILTGGAATIAGSMKDTTVSEGYEGGAKPLFPSTE